jgi:ABC-2 type transport system permease protein
MSANIYLHEFRQRMKSVLIWSLSTAAIIFVFSSIFPGFVQQADLLNSLFEKMPPALLDAFGMQNINMATLLGFFAFVFVFVQLCLAIQAGNYGFGLVSIEENEMTADFLLTKPVSRTRVLTSKLLAALTSLTLTNAVVWAVTFICLGAFNGGQTYATGTVLLILASNLLFQLFFLAVGLVISLLVKRIRSVTPYSLGLGFGTYVLSAFSAALAQVSLEYITPFKHFDPAYIVRTGSYDAPLVAVDVVVSLIALAASYWLYSRRDVHAVS